MAASQPQPDPVGKRADIFYEYRAHAWLLLVDKRCLARIVAAMQAASGFAPEGLWLISDSGISELNSRCLDCSGPTNILTFPGEEGGSLYLSLDCMAREAFLYGQNAVVHMIRLLAHGFGHLAGFDHGDEHDAIQQACFEAGLEALDNMDS